MPSRAARDLEDAVIIALTDRLEGALELATRSDAISQLEKVVELCEEAQVVARAGLLLLARRR